jgi:polypeptide N-acetylgalactosaminyltransferase
VVDRLYFEEIGLLDEGMEVYGGENVELGVRVSNNAAGTEHCSFR